MSAVTMLSISTDIRGYFVERKVKLNIWGADSSGIPFLLSYGGRPLERATLFVSKKLHIYKYINTYFYMYVII